MQTLLHSKFLTRQSNFHDANELSDIFFGQEFRDLEIFEKLSLCQECKCFKQYDPVIVECYAVSEIPYENVTYDICQRII